MGYDPVANDFAMYTPQGGHAVKVYIDQFIEGNISYDEALAAVARAGFDEVYDTAVREAIYHYVASVPRRDPLEEVW